MTQEEKELLLKDLCGRLPYHTVVRYRNANVDLTQHARSIKLISCKPYLRPLSSMTNEEYNEYSLYDCSTIYDDGKVISNGGGIDWLIANHFDYRGLIPMGLALEVTENNNPYKE